MPHRHNGGRIDNKGRGHTGREQPKAETGNEDLTDTLKQRAGDVMGRFGDFAGQAKDSAREIASQAGDQLEGARTGMGRGIKSVAGSIRRRAPEGGALGTVAESVADPLERAGSYLQAYDFGEMGKDLMAFARRHPFAVLCVGMGLGFLMARSLRD
jgi:ElaB/YqjD/DUF883 family membrane-anchored ribosome-binding protein